METETEGGRVEVPKRSARAIKTDLDAIEKELAHHYSRELWLKRREYADELGDAIIAVRTARRIIGALICTCDA